ncbi:DUF4169 family protein [Pseudochrobactrum sp. MP213Fo]|uniref:DUF4169 family protein n=1 Tax=Pseudochrobactrum sp. MP213Fo TaxID=3022250 RepID=UPI003B9FCDAD
MSDIINLKQFKKRKTRSEQQQQADANRLLFGRTKTEKAFAKNQSKTSENFLDLNRLEPRPKLRSNDGTEDSDIS